MKILIVIIYKYYLPVAAPIDVNRTMADFNCSILVLIFLFSRGKCLFESTLIICYK